jgi:hypothetical protein
MEISTLRTLSHSFIKSPLLYDKECGRKRRNLMSSNHIIEFEVIINE